MYINKPKNSAEIKIEIVRGCLSGHLFISEAARQCGMDESGVRIWLSCAKSEGFSTTEVYLQKRTCGSDSGLDLLLQYGTNSSQFGRINSVRKAPIWIGCIKNAKGAWLLAESINIFHCSLDRE